MCTVRRRFAILITFAVVLLGVSACLSDHCDVYPSHCVIEDLYYDIGYFKASNTNSFDNFGVSVTLSGDGTTLAVGAYREGSSALGINGDQANNSAQRAGAVYVFVRDGAAWSQQAYVKASNTNSADNFGYSVALSDDGNTLAVSAPFEQSNATGIGGNQVYNSRYGAGAVYVFLRVDDVWSQQAYVKASNTDSDDNFGFSVALSNSGDTLAVGAPGEASRATGIDGDQADNSSESAGAAYLFTRSGDAWSQQAYVKASNTDESYLAEQFGSSLALSGDGNTLAVGALDERSGATGIGGDQANNDVGHAGAVYVFTPDEQDTWSQQAYVKASNTDQGDEFGISLALSDKGNTLAVGAAGEGSGATGIDGDQSDNSATFAGAVYVFVRDGVVWSQQAYIKASNAEYGDFFGLSAALSSDGDTLLVGADQEDGQGLGIGGDQTNGFSGSGAVYVFVRDVHNGWSQQNYAKASNTNDDAYFGTSVALSADGDTWAVGARGESSRESGIWINQPDSSIPYDESATDAGAVYVY